LKKRRKRSRNDNSRVVSIIGFLMKIYRILFFMAPTTAAVSKIKLLQRILDEKTVINADNRRLLS